MKRFLQIALASLLLVLVTGFAALILFRTPLLHYAVRKVQEKFAAKYPARLVIGSSGVAGFNSVILTGIEVLPDKGSRLLRADSVYTSVSVSKLLFGRVVLNELNIVNASLTPRKTETEDNFTFFFRKKKGKAAADSVRTTNYGELANSLIENAFDKVPEQARFRNLSLDLQHNGRHVEAQMPFLDIKEGAISSRISYISDSLQTNLALRGRIDRSKERISGKMYATDTAGIRMPYVQKRFGAKVLFDTLQFSLTDKDYRNKVLRLEGAASASHVVLNHPRISLQDVRINNGSVRYRLSIGPKFVALDTLSSVTVNQVTLFPILRYEKLQDSAKIVRMHVYSERTPAQDFFNSLPEGMFENLDGIQATGFLKYQLHFFVDTRHLDSLRFDSDLDGEGLKITKWGNTDLSKINGTFEQTVYEYGKPARTFTVGPGNPFYTPIGAVSDYLKNAILTAEDYGFYKHKGFHEEAFRQALVQNIKHRKFLRGGSTISMQLVKNVYLTRNKTISRKVEEALIVWLIENLNLVPKYRMLEVYLNIIEWGPYIYGVKDASRFYFAKQPADLTLAEAIFLTRIIPSPKNYRSLFDHYGRLKPWVGGYYRLIGGIMRRRGLISEEEWENLYPQVYLRGRARDIVVTADSLPPDSVLYPGRPNTAAPEDPEAQRILEERQQELPELKPLEEEQPKEKKKFRLFNFGKKKDKQPE